MASIQTPKQSKQGALSRDKKRVFIDSSVLMAAAISPTGSARELINQGFTEKIDLYISLDVAEETERNLRRKAPHWLNYFYKTYESLSLTSVKPTKKQILNVAKFVVGKDAPIVAGAIAAKADFLVSFDRKHLLEKREEIETNFNIKVVTPDEVTRMIFTKKSL